MAKKDDAKAAEEQAMRGEAVPEEPQEQVAVMLNPITNLGSYGFADGFGIWAGNTYLIDEDKYKEYAKVKRYNHQVLIKA